MCGRYALTKVPDAMSRQLNVTPLPWQPRFNLAPTQDAAIVVGKPARQMIRARWGLVPFWAKDITIGSKMINARSESLTEKPAFKRLFERRRCLVLADGFYEWKKTGSGKAPYRIFLKDGEPFAMAGLWDAWKSPVGAELLTFSIITTSANDMVRNIHNRMPVILQAAHYDGWLDPEFKQTDVLQSWLRPYAPDAMACHPVSTIVNSTANDSPQCLARAEPEGEQLLL